MKLLLAEDERRMAEALLALLKQEGYDVDWHADGTEALLAAQSGIYDIIVLDVMLPSQDGFSIAHELRRAGTATPILMLTARGELEDKVRGLDSGADDYLVKPFLTAELLARLRALSRRGDTAGSGGELSVGDIALDEPTLTLRNTQTGESVRLSDKEFRILEYFARNRNRILTREQLAQRIWGSDCDAEYNKVEVYLTFTRKKLAFVDSRIQIKAVRGIGYELHMPDEVLS
ncbi:MAG: response regulator transcription factor [Coriobacteriales bacterium]